MILAFCWFKQAVALVSFPRVALGKLCSSRTWVSTRYFCPVSENHVVGSGFSDGSRLETLDISGSCWLAAPGKLSSAVVEFVAPWCYALARSWTSSDGWFQGEPPADRRALEGAVAKAGSVSFERFQRVQRFKRASCTQRVVLNCPVLDIAHRRLVQSECRYGAEPRPCPGFLPSLHFVMKN